MGSDFGLETGFDRRSRRAVCAGSDIPYLCRRWSAHGDYLRNFLWSAEGAKCATRVLRNNPASIDLVLYRADWLARVSHSSHGNADDRDPRLVA